MKQGKRIAILGAGNIGTAIADGLVQAGTYRAADVFLTRRHLEPLAPLAERGFAVGSDNLAAVAQAQLVIVAVEPQQIDGLLAEIAPALDPQRHVVVSVVTGVSVGQIERRLGQPVPVVRAMPNTAIAVRESMTCLAADASQEAALALAETVFSAVGRTVRINEEDMGAATALGACGIAFFMRAIRAASQGGIEIGFHAGTALAIAAQTAKGAACLLQQHGSHPEREIDRVTTPRGCTIAGLNRMEHEGFSSALIQGITVSAQKAAGLYRLPGQGD